MKIAYIGTKHGTSLHRANALARLGHEVAIVDPRSWLGSSKSMSRYLFHAGGLGIDKVVKHRLYEEVSETAPDLIWINDGAFLGPPALRLLRTLHKPMLNYSGDNPFATSSPMKWNNFLKAVPEYDLIVQTFEDAATKLRKRGARNVMRVFLSADEVAHKPSVLSPSEIVQYGSKVAFIGQWAPERGRYLAELIRLGVPLSLWGDRWYRAKEWPLLKRIWRGPGMFDDERYAKVIQASKISLCFLYRAAGNLHTSRSLEIPSLGGLLCAERSKEHLSLYTDGQEAVFWDDVDECAKVCKELLADEPRRARIAQAGHERALRNNLFNEPILASIISAAMQGDSRVEVMDRSNHDRD